MTRLSANTISKPQVSILWLIWPNHRHTSFVHSTGQRSKQLLTWLHISHHLTSTSEVSHSFLPGTSPLLSETFKKAHMALSPFLNWKSLKWKTYLKHFAVPSIFSFLSCLSVINNRTFHRQWFYKKLYSKGLIVLLERAVTNTSQFITKYTPKLSRYYNAWLKVCFVDYKIFKTVNSKLASLSPLA